MKKTIVIILNFLVHFKVLKPIHIACLKHFYKFHSWPNYESPKDLNEKINWIKFYGDTSRWAELADKYKVRSYIAEKGYSDILVKLYGKWDKAEDIDWELLPKRFVLKVNNGCGDILICNDKNTLDKDKVVKKYAELLKKRYGVVTAEPHYAAIKPCIIAEELLDANQQANSSTSLIDYKIWCINGKPYFTWCAWNRHGACSAECGIYDLEWKYRPEFSVFTDHYFEGKERLNKPQNLEKMYEIASNLSADFPILRVDLYEVNNKIYFGELTFTPLGGYIDYLKPEILRKIGEVVKL